MSSTERTFSEIGEITRRKIVGDDYVDHMIATRDSFDAEWQEYLTNQLWGRTWARGIIDHPTLSLINMAMLAGRNCLDEFEIHLRTALTVTHVPLVQIRELLLHIAMYCGAPIGRNVFLIARRVLTEYGIDTSDIDGTATVR